VIVVLGQVAVDSGLKVDDRSEDTTPDALASEFREKAFNGIEPEAGLRGESGRSNVDAGRARL